MKKNILFLIVLLGFILRLMFIDNNNVFFYFDQARDATISRQIIEGKDFKIMGPSVSGTNDSVYHGVLYYYLIAPVYSFSQGSPYAVAIFLAVIGTLSILITFKLGETIFNSESVGLIAALLHSVSAISIQQSTWLSNPSLSGLFIPLTYYFIWRIFFSGKKQAVSQFILLGVLFALSVQSALQNITIAGSLIIAYVFYLSNHKQNFEIKKILAFLVSFVLGISSILITELLMFKRGILSFDTLNLEQHAVNFSQIIQRIITRYYSLFSDILNPSKQFLIPFLLVVVLIIFLGNMKKRQLIWSLSYTLAPVWLLIWHYRDPNHTFIGIEVVVFLLLANGLSKMLKADAFKRIIAALLVVLFVVLNISQMKNWKSQEYQYFGIQKGAFLNNQLNLIDKTYELSNGQDFSFSSLTSPYAINTTWNYLYKWHGYQKNGYLPKYVGINQNNFVGNNILPETMKPESVHFLIIEPDTTLSLEIQNSFLDEQIRSLEGEVAIDTYSFGTLVLKRLYLIN